ncbi:prephenate dehydrogenase/arogenate dehydrogenase family protein [Methanoregula sp.]|uniref:prephenate dehydrogenase/arogenate dehydrogenase family protein n=1 Tax=Methanoregula sp. TaxID=2052170 RepID=UPI002CF9D424|nr:prephenate dehydrogenase/arogenate dehydrogenase family protein [Methanoregula sp.]HVP95909.1 prephenate dehydrogenase/arogenate dehydrogenase family protein [Methanoregula sp.]
MKAGIIGGTGKMGKLFAPVFERAGYSVMVSGRSTPVTSKDIALTCDLVVVSVPIRDTIRVIGEIAPLLREDQLLCDFTSLKAGPVAAMLASKAQVIGLHPMFGPTVSSIARQTIVMCPARVNGTTLSDLRRIFTSEGAVCTIATPEEHDRMMAIVQGLTHFVTICMADSIRRLGVDIEKTGPFMSPVYQIELSLVGRLLSQDPALYGDILQENPFVPPVLDACRAAAGELAEIVASGDPEAFAAFFSRDTEHLGAYCGRGQVLTDALIECMVKK